MGDGAGEGGEKRKKAAPPSVRITGAGAAPRVVAKPIETTERRPDEAPSRPVETAPPEVVPPLQAGASVDFAGPERTPAAPDKRLKPPPPHALRPASEQPRTTVEPPRHEAAIPAAPGEPAAVRVRLGTPRSEPTPSGPEPSGPPVAVAEPPAAERLEGTHPHLSTDQGRLSALSAALSIILLVFVMEIYGGFASNSLALLSDAGHTFMDLFSYAIAYGAVVASQRKSSERETFGAHRSEIVAAFISGILLLLVVAVIWGEAAQRLFSREPVDLTYMLTVPWLAILANLYLSRRLAGGQDINIRSAHYHVLSDLGSAVGVLIAGLLILATGNPVFDPAISLVIGFLIFIGAVRILFESGNILLERTPPHIDVKEVMERVREVPGVRGVHAVHVWSLCSTVHALSAHIVVEPSAALETQRLLDEAHRRVEREYSIAFTTFQVELEDCGGEQHKSVTHTAADALRHAHT